MQKGRDRLRSGGVKLLGALERLLGIVVLGLGGGDLHLQLGGLRLELADAALLEGVALSAQVGLQRAQLVEPGRQGDRL
jgi:hypothetical protein